MPLQKRYKVALETKLDQLWYQGFCVIERWELAVWFDKERITNVVWREITETWVDTFDEEDNLSLLKCDDTPTTQTFVIVNNNRLLKMKEISK